MTIPVEGFKSVFIMDSLGYGGKLSTHSLGLQRDHLGSNGRQVFASFGSPQGNSNPTTCHDFHFYGLGNHPAYPNSRPIPHRHRMAIHPLPVFGDKGL